MGISKYPNLSQQDNILGLSGVLANAVPDKTAFGETAVSEPTPNIQVQFAYNVNSGLVDTSVTGTGSVSHGSGLIALNTGATSGSQAIAETKDVLKYNTGQGGLGRFTAIFDTPVDGTNQLIGFSASNPDDGFLFGYKGAEFGIIRKRDGADFFIPQSEWNIDKMDGTGPSDQIINQQLGNVYQIRFQWLGFGAVVFSIENAESGAFQEVHKIKYANANLMPSILNPTCPIRVIVENPDANSDVQIKTASLAAFVEGDERGLGLRKSFSNSKTGINAETAIFSIRNKSTFAGSTNRVRLVLDIMSIFTDGNRPTSFRFVRNPSFMISMPSFSDIDIDNSVVEADTNGSTVSGGEELLRIDISQGDSAVLSLRELDLTLDPGDTLTITGNATGASVEGGCSLNWVERF